MLSFARQRVHTLFPAVASKGPLFEEIFALAPVALSVCDSNGVIRYANKAFSQLTGYEPSELVGYNISLLKSSKNPYPFFEEFWEKLHDTGAYEGDIWNRIKDGSERLHRVSVTKIASFKRYYLSTHTDITDESAMKERYHYLAHHDPLTGLANRTLLEDRLEHAIANAARTGKKIGVVYCDLNEFKLLNDLYGHGVGDELLKETAQRLVSFFRTNDTVARVGGDEFVVVIEHLEEMAEMETIIAELHKKMAPPYTSSGLSLTISIGYSCFPRDGLNIHQLLDIADTNMYQKKNLFYGLLD